LESRPLKVKALQCEHPELLTCTLTPLTNVASHVLLLEVAKLELQEYAPTYSTLIDPPYEFAPKEMPPLVVEAPQFEHPELLTCTLTPLTDVGAHVLLLEASWLRLQEYAPTYSTLIDPPYEFAPLTTRPLMVEALQFEHPELITCTLTPLADVGAHVLLLEASWPWLQEYAPTYSTLIDPPYEFAPAELRPLEVKALQFEHPELPTCTLTPFTDVGAHVLLLLDLLRLKLLEYAPTYSTLIDPPYEFAPLEKSPLVLVKASESIEVVFWTETCMSVAFVYPHVLMLLLESLRLQAYAPM
jgi:hypothetical protein